MDSIYSINARETYQGADESIQNPEDQMIKTFICPFNPYHKFMVYSKWQFHITRCGDRRGKVVYRC